MGKRILVGDDEKLVIPAIVDGVRVSEITVGAFAGNKKIKEVVFQGSIENINSKRCLPETVATCEKGSFEDCVNLERVVFENGVVENAGGKFMLYTDSEAKEIVIEKKEDLGEGFEGGNISDLGGYYNELVYFTDCAKNKKAVENTEYSKVGTYKLELYAKGNTYYEESNHVFVTLKVVRSIFDIEYCL